MPWSYGALDLVKFFLSSAGSIVAGLALARVIQQWWHRGPGRRRRWVQLYGRIALGVHISYVTGLFGEAAYQQQYEGSRLATGKSSTPRGRSWWAGMLRGTAGRSSGGARHAPHYEAANFTERVWMLADDGYLQVLTNELGNVVLYSLTTRNPRFRPKIAMGTVPGGRSRFTVRLGVTRFAMIPWPADRVFRGPSGATAPYEYRQSYAGGRAGGYADWTCTYNAAGMGPWTPVPANVQPPAWNHPLGGREWPAELSDDQETQMDRCRAGTVINTVTVEHFRSDRSGLVRYGPDREVMRLMPVRRVRRKRTLARPRAVKLS
jgi:hypothetical protein